MIENSYTPVNWYWIVNGNAQVFSSARAAYFPVNDAAYQAWLKQGNAPTKIDTESNLWEVLADVFPAGIPASGQDQLKTRQVGKSDQISFKIAFNHENRIRALEGKQAVTQAQFITAIKALL